MVWEGSTVFALWGYRPDTDVAIDWHKISSGNWRGSDRGATEDVYEARVTFEGPVAELTTLESVLDSNRKSFTATFNDAEEIFGADADHTGNLEVVPVVYGKIRKLSFKHFGMDLILRLPSPVFKSVTPDITILRTETHADTRETEFEINKMFSYDGDGFGAEHIANDGDEAGTYTAKFTQTAAEMAAIRRYLTVTARATKIAFPSFGGITQPFGTRAGTGPFNCRVIRWTDLGRKDFSDFGLSITFAKENSSWSDTTDIIQETGTALDQINESGSQPDLIDEVIN